MTDKMKKELKEVQEDINDLMINYRHPSIFEDMSACVTSSEETLLRWSGPKKFKLVTKWKKENEAWLEEVLGSKQRAIRMHNYYVRTKKWYLI